MDDILKIEEARFFPWALIALRPATGKPVTFTEKGLTATHFPKTATSREKIVIEKNGTKFVRTIIGTKFSNIRIA